MDTERAATMKRKMAVFSVLIRVSPYQQSSQMKNVFIPLPQRRGLDETSKVIQELFCMVFARWA
jgi:hypothetical protein